MRAKVHRNIICVKWGRLYGPEYVTRLYAGIKRHHNDKFKFHVFTDDSNGLPKYPDWVIHNLPDLRITESKAWFYKLCIFNKKNALFGRNIYIDLDCVIVGDISDMWTHMDDKFVICQDFNRVFIENYNGVNSSVMAWTNDNMDHMYRSFMMEPPVVMGKYRGDQDYIQAIDQTRNFWPKEWVMSYKWEIWRGGNKKRDPKQFHVDDSKSVIPSTCKIITFHGKPKPHEIKDLDLLKHWSG